MSLYQYHLKRDIQWLKDTSKRNKENIKLIKRELETGENVISFKAHYELLKAYIRQDIRNNYHLERKYRMIH